MEISEEHIILFESYLGNCFDENGRKDFETRLIYDSDFKLQFEQYKEIEKGIKSHYRNQLKNKLQELDESLEINPKTTSKSKKGLVIPIIISVLVAASLVFVFLLYSPKNSNYDQLAADFWPNEEGLPVKMSTKGKYDDAMNAYKMNQWNEAEKLLLKMESDTANYFLGVIDYEKNKINSAEKYFSKIQEGSYYYDIAQFRLALIYLKTEKIELAKRILETIIDNNNQFETQAKSILEQFK